MSTKKIIMAAAKDFAMTKAATTPSTLPTTTSAALDSTGNALLDIIRNLTQSTQIEAARTSGDTRAARDTARLAKDLATTWAMVHAELRQSLQAMTNEEYRKALVALASSLPADPPAPQEIDVMVTHEASTNFSENKNPSTTLNFDDGDDDA